MGTLETRADLGASNAPGALRAARALADTAQVDALVALRVERARRVGAPHLVEVGAVSVLDGEIIDHFHRLVCPLVPIDEEATRAHGIDEDAIRSADAAPQVLGELFDWIGERALVAHGAEHDAETLAFEASRHGLELPSGHLLDSQAIARSLIRDVYDHELETLIDHLELEGISCHGAAGEALSRAVAAWQVLEACSRELSESDAAPTPGGVSVQRLAAAVGPPRTLACYLPEPPLRRDAQLLRLERARAQGTRVILHYGSESSGHARPMRLEVLPGQAFRQRDHAYLEGECVRTGTLKTYRMDRILRVETVH